MQVWTTEWKSHGSAFVLVLCLLRISNTQAKKYEYFILYVKLYILNKCLELFHFSFSSIFKKSEPFQNPERNSTLLKWQVRWDICTPSTLFTGKMEVNTWSVLCL